MRIAGEDPEYVKTLTSAFNALDTDKDKKISLEVSKHNAPANEQLFTSKDVRL